MLLIKTIRWLAILLAIALFSTGCLLKKPVEVPVKTEKAKVESTETKVRTENQTDKIAVLGLSTPKPQYKSNEPIPVELTIDIGKFDLPVAKPVVTGERAFSDLIIKDANGKIVKPQEEISTTRIIKRIYQNERIKRCVQGIMLSKNETVTASLKNLRKFYPLKPGKYSLQLAMSLRVYHDDFVTQKPPAIADLEKEIVSIRSDSSLADRAKEVAIKRLKGDIERLENKVEKKEGGKKFLPLDSLRGKAKLKSNEIEITISSSPMDEEEMQDIEKKKQKEKVELIPKIKAQAKPKEEAEIPVMKLRLSSPKSTYTHSESLPLELIMTDISRNLPVARSAVYGLNAFSRLVVRDEDGTLIKPQKSLSQTRTIKNLYRNGKLVKCIQGLKLSQGDRIFLPLNDLSKYYSLKPGKYSLQLVDKFKIYKDEFFVEKPRIVIEYEKEIDALEKDTKLSESAKKDGIADLKKEIEFQMNKFSKGKQKKYLALDAVEEEIEVKSNEIQIQIR